MLKKLILFLLIAAVYILHQDFWNWNNTGLVFGFLPAGLAYHAAYSIACSILMGVLVKSAWPSHLEDVEPHEPDSSAADGGSH